MRSRWRLDNRPTPRKWNRAACGHFGRGESPKSPGRIPNGELGGHSYATRARRPDPGQGPSLITAGRRAIGCARPRLGLAVLQGWPVDPSGELVDGKVDHGAARHRAVLGIAER